MLSYTKSPITTVSLCFICYTLSYCLRHSFNVAIPFIIQSDIGITKQEIGVIMAIFSILYAFFKFINGMISDKIQVRYTIFCSLIASSLLTLSFGFFCNNRLFVYLWVLNAVILSISWAPCAKIIVHLFEGAKKDKIWSVCNSGGNVGIAIMNVLGGVIATYYGWRYLFIIPAIISMLIAFIILRVEDNSQKKEAAKQKSYLAGFKIVITNKALLILCISYFFAFTIKASLMTWLPCCVFESGDSSALTMGIISGGYEITSFIGSLLAAHFAGKFFKSDNVVTCIFLIAVLVSAFCLLLTFGSNIIFMAAIFFTIGFSINIVQTLFVIEACSMGDKSHVGLISGFIGLIGYFGNSVSVYCIGMIASIWNWNMVFVWYIGCAIFSIYCLLTLKFKSPNMQKSIK